MGEIYHLIITLAYEVWKKRFYALAAAWAISVIGWTFISQMPNRYQSQARVLIDAESVLRPLMKGMAIDNNPYGKIMVMHRTLTSYKNISKLLRKTDLYLRLETDEEKEKLIETIQKNVSIEVQGNNIFTISYEDNNPVDARDIVQGLIDIFSEQEINNTRIGSNVALNFIEQQISIYEDKLNIAEENKLSFRQKNMIVFAESGNFFTKMQNSKKNEAKTRRDIKALNAEKKTYEKQLKDVPKYIMARSSSNATSASSALLRRLEDMESKLNDYYAIGRKNKHPDVLMLLKQIKLLKKQAKKEDEEFKQALKTGDESGLSKKTGAIRNPDYLKIMNELRRIEGKTASLQSKLVEESNFSNKLNSLAIRAPEIEAEYQRLNRDYGIIKKTYDGFLKSRETTKISIDLDTNDRVMFKTLDPSKIAREPSSPKRALLVFGTLFMGLVVGVVIAFLLSQIYSTFSSESKLRETYGFPVLGSVSVISTDEDIKRQKKSLMVFFLLFGSLVLCAIVVYFSIYFHYNINIIE